MKGEHNPVGDSFADLQDDLAALKNDMANLRDDVADMLRSVVDMGRTRAGDAKDRMQEKLQSRLDRINEAMASARDRSSDAVESVQTQMEEHPLLTVGVAFGAGLLIGSLIQRS